MNVEDLGNVQDILARLGEALKAHPWADDFQVTFEHGSGADAIIIRLPRLVKTVEWN